MKVVSVIGTFVLFRSVREAVTLGWYLRTHIRFMEQIAPVASQLSYMVAPGNHEVRLLHVPHRPGADSSVPFAFCKCGVVLWAWTVS